MFYHEPYTIKPPFRPVPATTGHTTHYSGIASSDSLKKRVLEE
jgi:hypothetical protein